MTQSGALSTVSSHDISTFFHHTELGEAIKQATFARETYLGVAKVYGLRNKEYLLENLEGLKEGDRVTLYRKYNKESPDCTGLTSWAYPDDGASIRVLTLTGMCLGYIQPPDRFIMAELMKAGKHLYAKAHSINITEPISEMNTQKVLTLDVYWVEESNPLKMANTYEIGDPKYEAMKQNGNAIWLSYSRPDREFRFLEHAIEAVDEMKVGDRLRLIKKATEDNPWAIEIWSSDKKFFLGHMESHTSKMLAYMMDAGKLVYGVVRNRQTAYYPHLLNYDIDVYVEDN